MNEMQLIDLQQLATLLNRNPETIKKDMFRNPKAVPPRFMTPGTRLLRWRLADVIAWQQNAGGAAEDKHVASSWPRMNLKSTLEQLRPSLEFVLPNLLKGSLGLLAGPGGVGKTNFLLQLGIELAIGSPLLGGWFPAQAPKKVALVLAEESAEVMACRLHDHLGSQLKTSDGGTSNALIEQLAERLIVVPAAGLNTNIVQPGASELFDKLAALTSGSDIIILDPIRRFHGGDENSSADMTRVVQQLETLALCSNATVLAAHHISKSAALADQGQSQQAARGSSALTDGVRWQANLLPVTFDAAERYGIPESERSSHVRLVVSKANYGPALPEVLLKRTAQGSFVSAHGPTKSPDAGNVRKFTPSVVRYV